MTQIEDIARRTVQGIYPAEAGIELLIRLRGVIVEGAAWVRTQTNDAGEYTWFSIDPRILHDEMGAWSGSEQRIVRIALSLLIGEDVNLRDDLGSFDPTTTRLVLAALSHALGAHEHTVPNPDGLGYVPAGTHIPWPAQP